MGLTEHRPGCDTPIVDAHCHVLPGSFDARCAELSERDATFAALFPVPDPRIATAETLLADMDRAGVTHAVVMGMGWRTLDLAREVNDYLAESVSRRPDRLTGFCAVNPAWGPAAASEIRRCANAGLRGLGELHPDTQGFDVTDPAVMGPIMDALRELGWPVVMHASEPVGHQYPGKGRTTPDKLYRFIENFPDNVIVCAHWGGGLPFYGLMPEAPQVLANVYFDSAASPFLYRPEVFDRVADLAGADKILFGTDYPLISHRRLMRQVYESKLSHDDRQAVLGGNAGRVFGLAIESPSQDQGATRA